MGDAMFLQKMRTEVWENKLGFFPFSVYAKNCFKTPTPITQIYRLWLRDVYAGVVILLFILDMKFQGDISFSIY